MTETPEEKQDREFREELAKAAKKAQDEAIKTQAELERKRQAAHADRKNEKVAQRKRK